MSLSGSTSPRELAENVDAADWSPDGEKLAVLRLDRDANTDIVEYPLGHAIYHTTRPAWLSHLRLSPDGKLLAVLHHTGLGDDRGDLLVLNTVGAVQTHSETVAGIEGVAWRSNDKIWVSATSPQNIARQLYEVDLRGRLHLVRDVPGEITMQDVAPDGSMLLTVNDRRILLQALTDGHWRDLSWLDRSIFAAFSADGSSILFHEGGEGGGVLGTTHVRKLDGSPPVRLSEGYSIDISPDQKWVLVYVPQTPTLYKPVPTGAGTAKVITAPDVPQAFPLRFARDRNRILWDRNKQGGSAPDVQHCARRIGCAPHRVCGSRSTAIFAQRQVRRG